VRTECAGSQETGLGGPLRSFDLRDWVLRINLTGCDSALTLESANMSSDALNAAPTLPSIPLVDDHDDLLQIWTLLLELHSFHVLSGCNGQVGLIPARQERPALTITDLAMPVLDGLALCRAIRDDEVLSSTFIILWTAGTLPAAPHPADVVIRNPVAVDDLVSHIHSLLDQK
jgi:CheY-like chemotaxis protein